MRATVLALVCLALTACATKTAPTNAAAGPTPAGASGAVAARTKADSDESRQACLSRMYAARMRGAVHWHIYENCLKEEQ